jgi:hypothetical protein
VAHDLDYPVPRIWIASLFCFVCSISILYVIHLTTEAIAVFRRR